MGGSQHLAEPTIFTKKEPDEFVEDDDDDEDKISEIANTTMAKDEYYVNEKFGFT